MPARSQPSVLEALDALQGALDLLRASLLDPGPSDTSRLVGLKEAARQLSMHERTVRRLAKAGAGIKIGGTWRVDIEAFRRR